jgi:hypothetical protein
VLVWSGHSSEEVSVSWLSYDMVIHTGGQSLANVAGNLRHHTFADSRQQVTARCAKQQAVECHDR